MLKTGHNVWVKRRADAAQVLIDAAEYYASLWRHLPEAERVVFILGWDIDSRVPLLPGRPGCPGLGALLSDLVRTKPALHVYLLLWDFSSIYLFGREAFQSIKLGLATDPRIHFRFDDEHPLSASHHQKVVVIDDRIAYSGGIDLTGNRWDTAEHRPDDPRRINAARAPYAPFHDVQMAVTGAPARDLGQLCRERWWRATGERLPPPDGAPASGRVDLGAGAFIDVPVGIARTLPAFKRRPEVREVERLFADMIEGARDYLYIENQYFSSSLVCRRLCESLRRPYGPEIVMVLPKMQDCWLAKVTMGTLSMRCILAVMESDRYGRFRAYYPEDKRLAENKYVNVHSKVMVVDDRFVRIGSANMNNRSMGLDTECDLVIDAESRPDLVAGVRTVLYRLLADHTGRDAADAARARRGTGCLREAIIRLSAGSPQTLEPYLFPERISRIEALIGELEVVDLDQPTALEQALDRFVYRNGSDDPVRLPERVPAGVFLTFVLCLTLAGAFSLSPILGDVQALAEQLVGYSPRSTLEAGVATTLAFLIGGLAFVPYNLMVVATASVFPAGRACVYILAGGLASALLGYALGRLVGRSALRRVFAAFSRIAREAAIRQTVLSVFLVRFFPLAPFALMNMVAGTLRVRLWPYLGGTLLGLLPGTISLVFFQRSLMGLIREPSLGAFLVFAAITLAIIRGFRFLSRRFGSRPDRARYA